MSKKKVAWAWKGGALKRAIMFDLRLLHGYLKSLKPGGGRSDGLHYGEREFSFEETPAFQFKTPSMRLLCLPCITPAAGYDGDDDSMFFKPEKKDEFFDEGSNTECSVDIGEGGQDNDEEEEGRGIDSKAEEFIARFYAQMKLQRQASLLRYNEIAS